MLQNEYPRFATHKELHAEFLNNIDALKEKYSDLGDSQELAEDVLDMVQNWLINHIADEDTHYAEHVNII